MMSAQVKCNDEQRLFVISETHGYSALGYDNCFRHCEQLSELLGRPDLAPSKSAIGTLGQYESYRNLVGLASEANLGTYFEPGTPPEVRRILSEAMSNGHRLSIQYGDEQTGEPWGDRPERGTIGRSGGTLKVPLLIRTTQSFGGEAVMTANIVQIRDLATGHSLYEKPLRAPRPEPELSAGPRL